MSLINHSLGDGPTVQPSDLLLPNEIPALIRLLKEGNATSIRTRDCIVAGTLKLHQWTASPQTRSPVRYRIAYSIMPPRT